MSDYRCERKKCLSLKKKKIWKHGHYTSQFTVTRTGKMRPLCEEADSCTFSTEGSTEISIELQVAGSRTGLFITGAPGAEGADFAKVLASTA